MPSPSQRPGLPSGPGRLLGAVFGVVFAGIGITVITGLWSMHGFGEPPVFFKAIGSFIAVAFVAFGVTFFFSAFKGQPFQVGNSNPASSEAESGGGSGYKCPACGARLDGDAEVSPRGDVKCGYCKQWFNIHAQPGP